MQQLPAQVIVNETFDYADTTALLAKWGSPTGLTLDASAGNPAPEAAYDGSAVAHSWIGSTFSLIPTDAAPVVLTADLWYTGKENQRNTVGLRNGANPLFEMGFYNQSSVSVLLTHLVRP
jgi:hypothetical protein